MPKQDTLKRIDQTPPATGTRGPSLLQVSKLSVSSPYSGDFQIINNGRLIVGEDPDIGARGILSPVGLFGYNYGSVRTFALYFASADGHAPGDWYAGNPTNNRIEYNQAKATLGLYNANGAGFLVDTSGSLHAGAADGAHMTWDNTTGAWRIYSGPEHVAAEIDAKGNAAFVGKITATGGSIDGDMAITARLRVGDIDGPAVYVGKEINAAKYEYALIGAHDAANLANFVVRAGQAEDNGDGFYFSVGNMGDYSQRMTYTPSGGLQVDGVIRAREFLLLGGGTIDDGGIIENEGKIVVGSGNEIVVMDGIDPTYAFYAGNADPVSAPFSVERAGVVKMTGAVVSGRITATSGAIGGFGIGDTAISSNDLTLRSDTPSIEIGAATGYNAGGAGFWVGNDGGTYKLRVGNLPSSGGNYMGWDGATLTLNAGNLGGTVNQGLDVGTTGNVRGGASGYNSGTGFWLGYDAGAYKFFVGNNGGNKLLWTGSSLELTGVFYATGGHISGDLYVGSADPRIRIAGSSKYIESTNFVSGTSGFRIEGATGNAEFNNITARGAIKTAVFEKSLVTAFAGSQVVSKSASTLHEACTVSGSTFTLRVKLQAGGAPFANGDIVRLKDETKDTWATVDTGTNQTTYWQYTATYRSGTSSGTYPVGLAVIDYGQSGDGLIWITADDGSYDPYISIKTHSGSPWSAQTERARLGNLTGISGASGYGLWSDNVYLTGTFNINNPGDIATSTLNNDAGWTPGAELIYNGSAEEGTTNWTTWTRQTSGGYSGAACFSTTGYQQGKFNDNYISVDPRASYELSAVFRTGLSNTQIWAGVAYYTKDNWLISVQNAFRYEGYDTTLYEAIAYGATTVKIVPPTQDWATKSYPYIQFAVQANGADLPNFSARPITNIDKGGAPNYWTLTLSLGAPAAYSAGTAVGLSSAGGSYGYALGVAITVGTSWTKRTAVLSSVNAWNAMPTATEFRIGTAKIRFVVLANWNQTDTTYLDAVSLTQLTQTAIDAAKTATNYIGPSGVLVNTPSPTGAGLYLSATHMGYYNGSVWKTYMDNIGGFYFSGNSGARIAWDGTDLFGSDGTTVQWYARAITGKLYAGAGAVYLDKDGVNLTYATDETSYSKMVKWWNGSNRIGQMYTKEVSSEPWLMLESTPASNSKYSYLHLRAYGKDSSGGYNSAVVKLRGGNDATGDTGLVQVLFNNNVVANLSASGHEFMSKTTGGVTLRAKAISGQTADLLRAVDASGNPLWAVTVNGAVTEAKGTLWLSEWLEDTQSDGNGMKFHYGTGSWWATDTGGSTQYAYMIVRLPYLLSKARITITKGTIYYNTQTTGAYITSIQIMQSNYDGSLTQLYAYDTDLGNGSTGNGSAEFYSGALYVPDKPLLIRLGYTNVSSAGDVRVYGVRLEYNTVSA